MSSDSTIAQNLDVETNAAMSAIGRRRRWLVPERTKHRETHCRIGSQCLARRALPTSHILEDLRVVIELVSEAFSFWCSRALDSSECFS